VRPDETRRDEKRRKDLQVVPIRISAELPAVAVQSRITTPVGGVTSEEGEPGIWKRERKRWEH
jgi:hypothetical protein